MAYTFMSPESKARREAELKKARERNLKKKRGGRPRLVTVVETPSPPVTVTALPVQVRPAATKSSADIPPTFAGAIAAFQRNPRK